MVHGLLTSPKALVFTPLVLLLLLIIACGAAATPQTVAPTASATAAVAPTASAPAASQVAVPTPVPQATAAPPQLPSSSGQPIVGGFVPLQAYAAPDHWGTHSSGTLNSIMFSSPMYNQLIEYNDETDNNDDIRGDIAKSWEITNGGQTYIFKIHDGIKFHNGAPLTSEDVAFSINRMVEPGETRPRAGEIRSYMEFGAAKAVDDSTVQVDLKFPSADFITFLAADVMKILSKDVVESGVDVRKLENVVGSGPFTVKETKRDVSTEYEFNPNYFKTGIGGARKPYLDGMIYHVIVEKGTIIAAFKTNQVLMSVTVTTNLSREERTKLVEDMGGELVEHGSTYGGTGGLMFNTTREPFDDPRVRKAIALAINTTEIVEIATGGDAYLGSPLPPGTWFGPTVEEAIDLPRNRLTAAGDKHPDAIAEAKRLLVEAGLGTDWELTLTYRTVVAYPVVAPVVKDQLQDNLGITVKLEALESSTGLKRWRDLDFGMAIQGHAFSTYAADAIFSALYRPGGTRNYANYTDPVIEDLFPKQAAELDQAARLELIKQMDERLLEVTPNWVPYWWGIGTSKLAHKSIKNLFGTPSTQNQLKQENFWFDPSEL